MHRTNIFLPEPMLKALRALAAKRGISVAELVRLAVNAFLQKESK